MLRRDLKGETDSVMDINGLYGWLWTLCGTPEGAGCQKAIKKTQKPSQPHTDTPLTHPASLSALFINRVIGSEKPEEKH